MKEENRSVGGGIGFCGLLTIVFVVLKLCKIISWSWVWVLAPSWIPAALVILFMLCIFLPGGETMNSVNLIGRLTKDPEIRWSGEMAVATFTVAIDRPTKRGEEKKADFPRVTVFGKQAENCEKYLAKGRLAGIQGRIQTGSFTNRNGETVYTTDVIADRVEFLEWGKKNGERQSQSRTESSSENVPEGFMAMSEDDCPF